MEGNASPRKTRPSRRLPDASCRGCRDILPGRASFPGGSRPHQSPASPTGAQRQKGTNKALLPFWRKGLTPQLHPSEPDGHHHLPALQVPPELSFALLQPVCHHRWQHTPHPSAGHCQRCYSKQHYWPPCSRGGRRAPQQSSYGPRSNTDMVLGAQDSCRGALELPGLELPARSYQDLRLAKVF